MHNENAWHVENKTLYVKCAEKKLSLLDHLGYKCRNITTKTRIKRQKRAEVQSKKKTATKPTINSVKRETNVIYFSTAVFCLWVQTFDGSNDGWRFCHSHEFTACCSSTSHTNSKQCRDDEDDDEEASVVHLYMKNMTSSPSVSSYTRCGRLCPLRWGQSSCLSCLLTVKYQEFTSKILKNTHESHKPTFSSSNLKQTEAVKDLWKLQTEPLLPAGTFISYFGIKGVNKIWQRLRTRCTRNTEELLLIITALFCRTL